MGTPIRQQGQEVRTVEIKECNDLVLLLDLRTIDPSDITFKLKDCGVIRIEEVTFEPSYSGRQLLSLEVSTVLQFFMDNLHLGEATKINGSNIREFFITASTFSHVPEKGFSFEQTDKLSIKDSVFERISPGSITAVGSKEILIFNNEFNINAVDVIKASKASKVHISCNRLLNEASNSECVSTSTTTSTSAETTKTTASVVVESSVSEATSSPGVSEKQIEESWVTVELIVGVTVGGCLVLLLLVIVIIVIMCKYHKKGKIKAEETSILNESEKQIYFTESESITEKKEAKSEVENKQNTEETATEEDPFLEPETDTGVNEEEGYRPRFSTPVWLSEIQDNKVFNKQKSLNNNTEEKVTQASETNNMPETPRRQGRPFPVRSISEIIDDDFDININAEEEKVTITAEEAKEQKTPETDF